MKKRPPMALIAIAFSRFVFSHPLVLSFALFSPLNDRWNPDKADKPTYQSYKVDINRLVQERAERRRRQRNEKNKVTRGDNDDGRWCSTRRIDFAVSFSPRSCC